MPIEIDQSGRIEETQRNTVIALAGKNFSFSALFKRTIKRKIKKIFQLQGKPKLFAIRTFACVLVLLIKKTKIKPQLLIIDVEYPGHEQTIKDIIWQYLGYKPEIKFKKIGKNSPAHKKAYFTYKRKLKPDCVIKERKIMRLAIKK